MLANVGGVTTSNDEVTDQKASIADLPVELLTDVLRYVLVDSKTQLIMRTNQERKQHNESLELHLCDQALEYPKRLQRGKKHNVLSVCKKFYFASLEVLYSEHEFCFLSFADLHEYLGLIQSDRKKYIAKIQVDIDYDLHRIRGFWGWMTGRYLTGAFPTDVCEELNVVDEAMLTLAGLPRLKTVTVDRVRKDYGVKGVRQARPDLVKLKVIHLIAEEYNKESKAEKSEQKRQWRISTDHKLCFL
ncbi:Hypothetical predicted protein [Lecanosticta acicola]|uniref:DUF7730 domain-containing protein n=1 Tax=Lecanosticta acicola TaxID=111012 RepID=A0AAI8Z007_9PEZI|nr:Hypothetical predicted protein [Lecanosticta acicola]